MSNFPFVDTSENLKFQRGISAETVLTSPTGILPKEFMMVSGTQTTQYDTFTRIGTLNITPSTMTYSSITFSVSFETSDATNTASIRLFNVSDNAAVGSSTFTTISTTVSNQSATITLPTTNKDYEVQLKLSTLDASDIATCTRASITFNLTKLT